MSDFENPYDSPQAPVIPEKIPAAGAITGTMLRYLKEAAPWLRFIGIIGFIGSGLIVILGIFSAVGTASAGSFLDEFISFPFWLFLPFNTAGGVILFFLSLFTYNFGANIRRYEYSNSDEDLEQAFKNNKSFWKLSGIICIIYLALIPFILVMVIIIGIVSATGLF